MRRVTLLLCSAMLLACLIGTFVRADDKAPSSDAAMDKLKALAGTWVSTNKDPKGKMNSTTVFKVTSGGSVVQETMGVGTSYEMVNMYHADGDHVVMTHYCAMGNQPTMELKKLEGGEMAFEYKNGTNLKSREEPHMDTVTLKIDGDKLSEEWGFYKDGKISEHETFTFTRQKETK